MPRIFKPLIVSILAGGISLPVFSGEGYWTFAGTEYSVQWNRDEVDVSLKRQSEVSEAVVKAECRSAISLPLRRELEQQLIETGLVTTSRWDEWPLAHAELEINHLKYMNINSKSGQCSGKILPGEHIKNLNLTAMLYALFFLEEERWPDLRKIVPQLLKDPKLANDAAALVTLMLADIKPDQAKPYFDEYVSAENLLFDETKENLAIWLRKQDALYQSLALAELCKSTTCQLLADEVGLEIMAQEAANVDSLEAYLN